MANPSGDPAGVGEAAFIGESTHSVSTVEKKPSIFGRVALVGAAAAIAGGGIFAVTRALDEPAGPSSPDEAVTQFFGALDDDDLLGLTEMMLPSEREAMVEPSLELIAELQRLDLIDPEMDVEGTSSFDFSVTGLEFVATEIGPGVARVRMLDGSITVSGTAADLPVGSLIAEEMGEIDDEVIAEEIIDFDEEDVMMAVVEEDGSWYVSLWYSVAELARDEADAPIPDFGNGLAPVGGDSPEDALETMIREAADLDLGGVIAMLDPEEFRALYDYAPLFVDDADEAARSFKAEIEDGFSWSIDRVDARSVDRRGRTVVVIDGFAASVDFEGERLSIDFADDCFSVVGPDVDERICAEELDEEFGVSTFGDYFQEPGITVVERDGRWYLSGFPTMIGSYTDLLAELDEADLRELEETLELLSEGGFVLNDVLAGQGDDFGFDEPDSMFDDPMIDEDPFIDETDEFEEIPVADEDRALFPEGFDLFANEPEWWFGFDTDLVPVSYTSGWTPDFDVVDVARFEPGSGPALIAALEADERYEPTDLIGLPDGAVAYLYPDVDVMVVVDDFVVSSWLGEDVDHVVEQVNFMAGN